MKKLSKINKIKLSQMVANELKEYIIKNRLKPGDMLPTEMELVDILGVSRSSVREGIKHLQNLGIVKSLNKKGLIIKEADFTTLQDYFQFHIDNNRIDRETLYEALMVVHLGILPMVIEKITDEDIQVLEKISAEWEEDYKSVQFARNKDIQFHQVLFDIAGNEIVMHYNNILKEYLLGKPGGMTPEIAKTNVEMHKDILRSLKERDLNKTIASVLIHNKFPKSTKERI